MGAPATVEEEVIYALEETAKEVIKKQGLVPYVISRDTHPEVAPLDPNGVYLTLEDGKVVAARRRL
jgi:hypothetical protein